MWRACPGTRQGEVRTDGLSLSPHSSSHLCASGLVRVTGCLYRSCAEGPGLQGLPKDYKPGVPDEKPSSLALPLEATREAGESGPQVLGMCYQVWKLLPLRLLFF